MCIRDRSTTDFSSNTLNVADFGGIVPTNFATVIPLDTMETVTAPVDTTCDAVFTHDALLSGILPYSAPGTYVLAEDGIDLGFDVFFTGTGTIYGNAAVSSALTEVGDGQVLALSNINAVYDFGAYPGVQEVSFVFFDGAGIENLKVNGHSLFADELEDMPASVAPGVTMTVTTTSHVGFQTGTVTLTGNVQKLEVGGQQFFVDHICIKHDGQINPQSGGGGCPAICDFGTQFEGLPLGFSAGDPAAGATNAVPPGSIVGNSDGIPIMLKQFASATGSSAYGYMEVVPSPGYGFGSGKTLRLNNITTQFFLDTLVSNVDTVCIEFIDYGGFENFSINGVSPPLVSPNGYGGLMVFDGATIGGVDVTVIGTPHVIPATGIINAFSGEIRMYGDVDNFAIGGQELWLDNLCISGDDPDTESETGGCDHVFAHESMGAGAVSTLSLIHI